MPKGYAVPELLPLFRRPDKDSYHVVRYKLIMRYLLGDESAREILEELPIVYHMYQNLDMYVALFGHKRAMRIFLSHLSRVTPSPYDEVSMLLELYKESDEYLEPLVDAILRLKTEVAETAPENLMKLFDEVISQAGSAKKTGWIRKVQVLLSYLKMLEQVGPEPVSRAIDILYNRMVGAPAPPPMPPLKRPSEVDAFHVLRNIALANANGTAVSPDELKSMFETPEQAAAVVRMLSRKPEPKIVLDKKLGGYVVTPIGLRSLEREGLITLKDKRKVLLFLRTSPVIRRLIEKGLLSPAEEKESEEGEEEEEE